MPEQALQQQVERMRRQQRALVELARQPPVRESNVEGAVKRLVEVAAETMGCARASVWMLSPDRQELTLVNLYEPEAKKHSTGISLSARDYPAYFAALETGRALDAHDARTDPRTREFTAGYLVPLGITSMLDAAIRDHGDVVGVVCHEHVGPPRTWSTDEVSFAGALADQVSLVLAAAARHTAETERERMFQQLLHTQKLESLGTMAAGVAHEINNPLAYLSSNLDFIADALATTDRPLPMEDLFEAIIDAQQGVERVQQIVRDLRTFSRPEAREKRQVDINAVCDAAAKMAWNEIRHRARLVKDYGQVPGVVADEAGLGQVVLNLLVNAAQSMEEGHAQDKEIRVSTRLDGDRVEIAVSDAGVGIPPETLSRIFDPFFTTKVGQGTGLGLSVSHTIVRALGGEILVTSERGKGSTFRVQIPVHRGAITPPTGVASLVAPAAAAGPRARILIVDDEEALITAVCRYFREEHEMFGESRAQAALARLDAGERFDVILCDLMMPEMTGMELHAEVHRRWPDMAARMVFLTGGAFTPKGREFLATVGNERLEKPFRMQQLRQLLRTRLA